MMTTTPIQRHIAVDGIELALWEWPGAGRPLVWVHANSFHARCWDQVIAHLDGYHCYALDLRGHGGSDKPAPPYHWRSFGADVAAVVRALDLRDAVGIGHSVGGHALTLAGALAPDVWARLLLVDPTIFAPDWYVGAAEGEHFAARRRNRWSGPDEMFERFKDREPFSRWEPAVLHDYCSYGLVPDPAGDGFVLACPPQIEASVYMNATAPSANIYAEIATITVPVHILRARAPQPTPSRDRATGPTAADFSASPTVPNLATHFQHSQDVQLDQYSHFIPMEAPALVAAYVREFAER